MYDFLCAVAKALVLVVIGLFYSAALVAFWTAPTVTTAGAMCLTAVCTGILAFALWGAACMWT